MRGLSSVGRRKPRKVRVVNDHEDRRISFGCYPYPELLEDRAVVVCSEVEGNAEAGVTEAAARTRGVSLFYLSPSDKRVFATDGA